VGNIFFGVTKSVEEWLKAISARPAKQRTYVTIRVCGRGCIHHRDEFQRFKDGSASPSSSSKLAIPQLRERWVSHALLRGTHPASRD